MLNLLHSPPSVHHDGVDTSSAERLVEHQIRQRWHSRYSIKFGTGRLRINS